MYEREGQSSPVSALLGSVVPAAVIGHFIWYLKVQSAPNDFWASKGAGSTSDQLGPCRMSAAACAQSHHSFGRYDFGRADAPGVQELRESYLRQRRDGAQVQPRPRARRRRGAAPTLRRRSSRGWPTPVGPTAPLTTPPTPPEPPGLDDGVAAAVLDEAEDILNAVGPELVAEVAGRAGRARRGGSASSRVAQGRVRRCRDRRDVRPAATVPNFHYGGW